MFSPFEFYNNVLRARGGKVPFGGWYPGLKDEMTTGTFVTTIVSRLKRPYTSILHTHMKLQP